MKILITLMISFFLYSCSATESSKVKYLIGVSQANLSEPWRIWMTDEIKHQASLHNDVRVIVTDASDTLGKQIGDVEKLKKYGINLLIISPLNSDALIPSMREVYSDIPVIILDRSEVPYDYTLYIGPDNTLIGKEAGLYVAESLFPQGGEVLEILGRSGSPPSVERDWGFQQEIVKNSRVKLQQPVIADWLRDKAEDSVLDRLENSSTPKIIFAHNDSMAYGAWLAAHKLKLTSTLRIIGVDGLPGPQGGLALLENGTLDATFVTPTGGAQAMEYALDILKGKKPLPKKVFLNASLLTKKKQSSEEKKDLISKSVKNHIVVSFIQTGEKDSWHEALTQSIREAAQAEGIELKVYDQGYGLLGQMSSLRESITHSVDAVILSPVLDTGWEPILQELAKQKIPLFLCAGEVDTDNYNLWGSYVGPDPQEESRNLAYWIDEQPIQKNKLNRILQIAGTEDSWLTKTRSLGFLQALDSKSRIVSTVYCDFSFSSAYEEVIKFLNRKISFNLIYAHSDDLAQGALKALEESKISNIRVVSIGTGHKNIESLKNGKISALNESSAQLGKLLIPLVIQKLRGEDIPRRVVTSSDLVTLKGLKKWEMKF